MHAVLLELV